MYVILSHQETYVRFLGLSGDLHVSIVNVAFIFVWSVGNLLDNILRPYNLFPIQQAFPQCF